MTLADSIRKYVIDHKIAPARQQGQTMVTIFAREVHAEMHHPWTASQLSDLYLPYPPMTYSINPVVQVRIIAFYLRFFALFF